MRETKQLNGVNFRKMMVKPSKYPIKSPYVMTPKKFTIHCTDNQMPAENEMRYMTGNDHFTSFPFATDEKETIQALPLNRNGFHAGDGSNGYGNRNTIGWEICRSYDRTRKTTDLIDPLDAMFDASLQNVIKCLPVVAIQVGIVPSFKTIKQHFDWSGKHCPAKILNDGIWNWLVNEIIKEYNKLTSIPELQPNAPKPKKIAVDGMWNDETTRALQTLFGTTVDGVISPISSLVYAMQKWLGTEQDGIISEDYSSMIAALQRKLGMKVIDGKVSRPVSSLVFEMQKRINNGTLK